MKVLVDYPSRAQQGPAADIHEGGEEQRRPVPVPARGRGAVRVGGALAGGTRRRAARLGAVLGLALLLLAGCGPATRSPILPTVAPRTTTAAAAPTRTFVPMPTRDPRLPTDTPIPTVPWPEMPQLAMWSGSFVTAVAWFPDGERLAATTSGGVLLADGATLAEVGVLLPGQAVATVEFSPDGAWMVLAVTDTVQLWQEVGGEWQSRRLAGGGGKVFGVALAPDGALLAAGEVSGTVRIWDPLSGSPVSAWQAHEGEVFDVAFSPDGSLLATAGRDGLVRLWQAGTWAPLRSYTHNDAVRGIAFSPDGRLLASASYDGSIGIWDVASGAQIRALWGHIAQVMSVSFSPDGTLLASGGMDGSVRVWDSSTGEIVAWSTDHIDPVPGVAFSPDGQVIASGGWDSTVRLWDPGVISR